MIATFPTVVTEERSLAHTTQAVELVGTHLRIAGSVRLGGFHRLSDYVSLQSQSIRLVDVTLLNRRGMPTADHLRHFAVRQSDVTFIAQRSAPPTQPATGDVRIEKVQRRILAVTTGHVLEGTVSLYPGADLMGFLESTDPPFLPVLEARVRWLADRRLKTTYEFLLLNRAHIIGVTGIV